MAHTGRELREPVELRREGRGGAYYGDGGLQPHVVPDPRLLCIHPKVAVDLYQRPTALDRDRYTN